MKITSKIKFIDVCSGIGITRLALEKNHWECVGRFETDMLADMIYQAHLGGSEPNFGDVTRLPLSLPEFDVLVAGIPGNSYSKTNRNSTRPDTSIPFALIELLYRYRPKGFIIECVSGFSDAKINPCFPLFISNLKGMGYDIRWDTFSATNYGLPLMSKRFFIVGSLTSLVDVMVGIDDPNVSLENSLIDTKNHEMDVSSKVWTDYLAKAKMHSSWNVLEEPELTIIDRRQTDLRIYHNVCPALRKGNHGLYYVKNGCVKKITAYEGLLLHGIDRFTSRFISGTPISEHKLMSYVASSTPVPMIELIGKWLETSMRVSYAKAA